MVYTTNREVVKRDIAEMTAARCASCDWTADDPSIVRSLSVEHVRKTTHTVQVERKSLCEYSVAK